MAALISFKYTQTGGFVGVHRSYEAILSDISGTEREQLMELIRRTGILEISMEKRTTPGARDMFFYSFCATESGAVHEVTFDDGTLPESYRKLANYLQDKLVDKKRQI